MKRQTMIANWLRPHQICLVVLFLNFSARAQTAGNDPSQGQAPPEAWEHGGYVIHQSVEIGYRASDVTGSQQMYNSLVDEQSGPRFLDQSLSIQSQTHEGIVHLLAARHVRRAIADLDG